MRELKSILIVDDDETSNFFTELLLKSSGVAKRIETLANGKEAIDFFSVKAADYPELILLDINMPLIDGFEFLDWFESNGHQGRTKVVIYSTAFCEEDKRKSTEYRDVIDYIEKPITQQKLDKLLKGIIG